MEKPILLVSNLLCSYDIISDYSLRYSIECLFKDLKSTSFNIHKTRLKKPEEVKNLIIIAALAFLLLTILAIQYDRLRAGISYDINISDLNNISNNQGGFELAVSYIARIFSEPKSKPVIFCPRF